MTVRLPTLRVGMLTYSDRTQTPEERVNAAPLEATTRALSEHPELDILVAPEWFLASPAELASPQTLEATQAALEAATSGTETLVIPGSMAWKGEDGRYRNTALVVSGGKTLKRYDKRSDGFDAELGEAHHAPWAPGRAAGTFEWAGLQAGVEICKDHADGRLRRDSARSGAPLDLQVVVSAGVWTRPARTAVKEGGLVLNDEATFYGPQVWERRSDEEAGFRMHEEQPPLVVERLGNGVELHIFEVPHPKPSR